MDIVVLLLQHGAQVDTVTKDMYTALHIAGKEGQEEVKYNMALKIINYINAQASFKNPLSPGVSDFEITRRFSENLGGRLLSPSPNEQDDAISSIDSLEAYRW